MSKPMTPSSNSTRDGRAVRLSPNAIITLHRCLRIQFAEPLIQCWSFSVGQSPMKKQ
jgi:hypothetical protein